MKNTLFVIAGMPRAGTTFLYHNLARHPEVSVPFRKELNMFIREETVDATKVDSLFPKAKSPTLLVDISPLYFYDAEAIPRMLKFNPEIRVIVGVRNPVSLVVSQFGQFSSYSNHPIDFWSHLKEHTISVGDINLRLKLDSGLFSTNLAKYILEFKDNLMLFDFSALQKNPLSVLTEMEKFLGLKPYFTNENIDQRVYNASGRKANRLLIKLAKFTPFIDLIARVLPYKATHGLRTAFDVLLSRFGGDRQMFDTPVDKIENELAIIFKNDIDFFKRIFEGKPTCLGSDVLKRCNHEFMSSLAVETAN